MRKRYMPWGAVWPLYYSGFFVVTWLVASCWLRAPRVVRDPSFGMEDSKASTIEERCQELGVIPQYIPFVSLAFSNLNSMTNLTSVEKLPGNYRLKLRGITGEVVSVYFIPRRDSDEEYAVGGRTKFGREIEYRFDRATTQMVGPLMYK